MSKVDISAMISNLTVPNSQDWLKWVQKLDAPTF